MPLCLIDWGSTSLLYIYTYIYMQCNGMQGLCAQLTGRFVCLIYIYIYIYIYICSVAVCKASMLDWLGRIYIFVCCNCIQGVYAQLKGGPIYLFGVAVFMASMLNGQGTMYIFGFIIIKASMLNWQGRTYIFSVEVYKVSMLELLRRTYIFIWCSGK